MKNRKGGERNTNMAMIREKGEIILDKSNFSTLKFYLSEYNTNKAKQIHIFKKYIACQNLSMYVFLK